MEPVIKLTTANSICSCSLTTLQQHALSQTTSPLCTTSATSEQ